MVLGRKCGVGAEEICWGGGAAPRRRWALQGGRRANDFTHRKKRFLHKMTARRFGGGGKTRLEVASCTRAWEAVLVAAQVGGLVIYFFLLTPLAGPPLVV